MGEKRKLFKPIRDYQGRLEDTTVDRESTMVDHATGDDCKAKLKADYVKIHGLP